MKKWYVALRGQGSWQAGLVALAAIALLLVAGERALVWQDEHQRLEDEKAAAAAATTEVEGLIDVSGRTSGEDIAKLLDGATGSFRSDLEAQADRLRKALARSKVTASGEVLATGVAKLEDGRATVIVAAAGTVRNTQTADPEPRNYRMRVDLQQYDGRWLVSGLEFVS